MLLQKLLGSFGVMFPAFTLPKAERSRNKERLEASLAGLCELELLKQRQERRVLSALCLGDLPAPSRRPWGALRSAHCSLDAPNEENDNRLGLQIVSLAHLSIYCRINSEIHITVFTLIVFCIWKVRKE